jgi:hypothetical protein
VRRQDGVLWGMSADIHQLQRAGIDHPLFMPGDFVSSVSVSDFVSLVARHAGPDQDAVVFSGYTNPDH